MRAALPVGLLAGLCAGFALGWMLKVPEPAGGVDAETPRATTTSEADPSSRLAPPREASGEGVSKGTGGAPTTSQAAPDGPALVGRGGPGSTRAVDWLDGALEAGYRRQSGGKALAPGERERLRREFEEAAGSWPGNLAGAAWKRERQREVVGTLAEPRILLQGRFAESLDVPWVPNPDDRWTVQFRKDAPLAVDTPPEGNERAYHVAGGILPSDRAFLVERVTLRAVWMPRRSRAHVELQLDPWKRLRFNALGKTLNARFEGRHVLQPGREDGLKIQIESASAEALLEGRFVPAGGSTEEAAPFRLVASEGDGFLTGDPIRIQIAADHGGRNPQTVMVDGRNNGYIREMVDGDVWDESIALDKILKGRASVRGGGAVPPGKVFEVTRVTWRARLLAGDPRSDLAISVKSGETIVQTDGTKETSPSGTWDGSVTMLPNGEEYVRVTTHGYAMIEVWVYGRLTDPPTPK